MKEHGRHLGRHTASHAMERVAMGAILVLSLHVVACTDDFDEEGPAPAAATPPKKPPQKSPQHAAAEAMPEADTYIYSPIGKRDPFRSYIEELKERGAPKSNRRLEETEKYELDQYRLTGLLTGSSQPQALVEDPQGRGHVLRIGSRLGKNGGRLTRITSAEIIVVEEFRDPKGKRIRVPITIKMAKPEIGSALMQ